MDNAIEITNLNKSYPHCTALDNINMRVPQGELFGIIGPDGAGKSTLFKILVTLVLPDSGTVRVAGLDAVAEYKQIRRVVGYMPGRFSLYGDLTVEENLSFFASIFGTTIQQNRALVDDIYHQIEPFRNRRARELSGGMKQKLALCCAMIHAPRLLFLDEPTTGVDPVSRKEFWGMLLRLKERGITIVVSTPYMDEATLCDRIALIQNGRFLQTDTPAKIIAGYEKSLWSASADDMYGLLLALRKCQAVERAYSFGADNHFILASTLHQESETDTTDRLMKALTDDGCKNIVLRHIQPTVEDCFMLLDKQR